MISHWVLNYLFIYLLFGPLNVEKNSIKLKKMRPKASKAFSYSSKRCLFSFFALVFLLIQKPDMFWLLSLCLRDEMVLV